jgi:hypothetical protein
MSWLVLKNLSSDLSEKSLAKFAVLNNYISPLILDLIVDIDKSNKQITISSLLLSNIFSLIADPSFNILLVPIESFPDSLDQTDKSGELPKTHISHKSVKDFNLFLENVNLGNIVGYDEEGVILKEVLKGIYLEEEFRAYKVKSLNLLPISKKADPPMYLMEIVKGSFSLFCSLCRGKLSQKSREMIKVFVREKLTPGGSLINRFTNALGDIFVVKNKMFDEIKEIEGTKWSNEFREFCFEIVKVMDEDPRKLFSQVKV